MQESDKEAVVMKKFYQVLFTLIIVHTLAGTPVKVYLEDIRGISTSSVNPKCPVHLYTNNKDICTRETYEEVSALVDQAVVKH